MATGEAQVLLQATTRQEPSMVSLSHAPAAGPGAGQLSQSAMVLTSLAAGAAAGALAKTTIAPLDRAKINFQTSHIPYSARAAIDFLVNSARKEGVGALWRGNSATMARIVPYAAVQFTAHEQWKRLLRVDTPATAKAHPVWHLVAGSLAGVTSQSATYPLDVARARMAVSDARAYRSLRQVFARIAREEGPRALYRGYPATVLGVVPYAGTSFFTYDSLKHKHLELFGSMPAGWTNMAFGGAAGALGQTASYPLDIVRRRMQVSSAPRAPAAPAAATAPAPPTILSTVRWVYKTEGWRGFFKGLSMNWVKGPLAVGISFSSYDAIKAFLRDLAAALP